eukprot:5920810-Pleurochrysis_carterae.AAC.2
MERATARPVTHRRDALENAPLRFQTPTLQACMRPLPPPSIQTFSHALMYPNCDRLCRSAFIVDLQTASNTGMPHAHNDTTPNTASGRQAPVETAGTSAARSSCLPSPPDDSLPPTLVNSLRPLHCVAGLCSSGQQPLYQGRLLLDQKVIKDYDFEVSRDLYDETNNFDALLPALTDYFDAWVKKGERVRVSWLQWDNMHDLLDLELL